MNRLIFLSVIKCFSGILTRPKESNQVTNFNFSLSKRENWELVSYPFIVYLAPAIIPYYNDAKLDRIDLVSLKSPPTHALIWKYLVDEISSEALLSAIADFEAELDASEPKSQNIPKSQWDIPSKSELDAYYAKLLLDERLCHKIMDLASLLNNKKFLYPLLLEFEESERDSAKMRKLLRGYYSLLSKRKLRAMAGETKIDVSGVKTFDIENFLRVHDLSKHKSPVIFLTEKGRVPDNRYSLVTLISQLPEPRKAFCFNSLVFKSYSIDRCVRYAEVYGKPPAVKQGENFLIRSTLSYFKPIKRRFDSANAETTDRLNADNTGKDVGNTGKPITKNVKIHESSVQNAKDICALDSKLIRSLPKKLPNLTPSDVDQSLRDHSLDQSLSLVNIINRPSLSLSELQNSITPKQNNRLQAAQILKLEGLTISKLLDSSIFQIFHVIKFVVLYLNGCELSLRSGPSNTLDNNTLYIMMDELHQITEFSFLYNNSKHHACIHGIQPSFPTEPIFHEVDNLHNILLSILYEPLKLYFAGPVASADVMLNYSFFAYQIKLFQIHFNFPQYHDLTGRVERFNQLTIGDNLVTQNDLLVIMGITNDNRLTDTLINLFFTSWLKSRVNTEMCLVTDSFKFEHLLKVSNRNIPERERAVLVFKRLLKTPTVILPIHIPDRVLRNGHWVLMVLVNRPPRQGVATVEAQIFDSLNSDISENFIVETLEALNDLASNEFIIIPHRRASFLQIMDNTCGWYIISNACSVIFNCSLFDFSILHSEFRKFFLNYILSNCSDSN